MFVDRSHHREMNNRFPSLIAILQRGLQPSLQFLFQWINAGRKLCSHLPFSFHPLSVTGMRWFLISYPTGTKREEVRSQFIAFDNQSKLSLPSRSLLRWIFSVRFAVSLSINLSDQRLSHPSPLQCLHEEKYLQSTFEFSPSLLIHCWLTTAMELPIKLSVFATCRSRQIGKGTFEKLILNWGSPGFWWETLIYRRITPDYMKPSGKIQPFDSRIWFDDT